VIVVRWVRAFVRFWIDFIVGDDWTVAAVVTVALLATWRLHVAGVDAWWLTPVLALAATAVSLRRSARREAARTEAAGSGALGSGAAGSGPAEGGAAAG
jgi:hypothetical protein